MENLTESEAALLRHWSAYGQRGTTPKQRVTPEQWPHKPFSRPVTTPWHVALAPDQLPVLILGFAPHRSSSDLYAREIIVPGDIVTMHIFQSMSQNPEMHASEDKWFIYSEGPDHNQDVRLHMHRSWSGNKHIELLIDAGFDGRGKDGTGPSITAIMWESDPEKMWKDADAATYMAVAREICSWVLDVHLGPEASQSSAGQGVTTSPDMARPTAEALTTALQNIPPTPVAVEGYRRA